MSRTNITHRTNPDPRRWKALSILALADFVVILDATIVNIALPSIGRELHGGFRSALVVGAAIAAAAIVTTVVALPRGARRARTPGRRAARALRPREAAARG